MSAGTRDYLVRLPRDVTVKAACEDVRCDNWRYGWDTILDTGTVFGAEWAQRIRSGQTGRTWREIPGADGITVFRFDAGQRCFANHQTRPARLLVRDRGGIHEHTSIGDWVGDFSDHMERLDDQRTKG